MCQIIIRFASQFKKNQHIIYSDCFRITNQLFSYFMSLDMLTKNMQWELIIRGYAYILIIENRRNDRKSIKSFFHGRKYHKNCKQVLLIFFKCQIYSCQIRDIYSSQFYCNKFAADVYGYICPSRSNYMHFVLKLHLLKILYTKNQQQTLKVLLLKLNEPYFMNLPYAILTDKIGLVMFLAIFSNQ